MSDRIKKIKIKQADGTYSDYIPIGADAKNIDFQHNGTNIEITLKKKPYYYENVEKMKLDDSLQPGDMAITLGYYEANDGGGATYKIRTKLDEDIEDNGSIHFIGDSLVAELITNYIFPELFGCKGDGKTDDTTNFMKLINYLYNRGRYNRIVELLPNKTYLLSNSIPINHSLQILGKTKNCNSIIKNITTDMFYVPESNTSNDNGTKKIWSYWFENINFIGSDNTKFMKADTFQHWGTKIINCNFYTFNKIFENLKLYCSHYTEIGGGSYSFGKISGSDNLIENIIYTGEKMETDRPLQIFELENLYLTRFLKCFITSSLDVNKGAKNIITMKNCRDITIKENWFDYCDYSAIFMENCNFVNVDSNTFRGVSRAPEGNYLANIELKACKNSNVTKNIFLNVHVGEQNQTAKAYRIWDYAGYISENIIIKNNKYEIPYYYQLNLTNKNLTKGIVIDEPSVYNHVDTGINLIQKYLIENSNSNGIFYNQDNYDNIVCYGTSTNNTSIFINGSYSSSKSLFTLKANKNYKAKINETYQDIQLALFNGSILKKILNNNDEYTPTEDIEITGVAIYIPNNKTYYFAKIKPQLFLIN